MAGTAVLSTIKHDVSGAATTFKDGAGTEIGKLCRGWVNYNGTSSPSTRSSFNVSSMTSNSAGNYTMNFSTVFSDADFSVVGMVSAQAVQYVNGLMIGDETGYAIYTSSVRVSTSYSGTGGGNGNRENRNYVCISVFR